MREEGQDAGRAEPGGEEPREAEAPPASPMPEPGDIEARLERRAVRETRQPVGAVIMSSLIGGLDVGFAPLGLAFVATHAVPLLGLEGALLLGALAYPIGFIFVILGRSQLFTESTLVPAIAVFSGTSDVRWLVRQWSLVLVANLAGAFIFALLVANSGPLATHYGPVLHTSTNQLLSFGFTAAFLSGTLAGWVMALLSWLLAVADSVIARIVFVWLATFLIGAAPLHHSVSGASEVLMVVMLGGASVGDWLWGFQVPATLGNAIGGVVLVGALKFLQARAGDETFFANRWRA